MTRMGGRSALRGWSWSAFVAASLLGACGAGSRPQTSASHEQSRLASPAPVPPMPFRFVPQVGHAHPIEWIALRPDGQTAITVGTDASFKLWSVGQKAILRSTSTRAPLRHMVLCGDGRTVAGGASDGTIHLVNSDTGAEVGSVAHGGDVTSLVALPTSNALLAVGATGIRIIDVGKRVSIGTIPDTKQLLAVASAAPFALARSTAGHAVVVGPTIESVRRLSVPVPTTANVAIAPNGSSFAVAGETVDVFDGATGAPRGSLAVTAATPSSLALDDDGRVYAYEGRQVHVFDAKTKQMKVLAAAAPPFAVSRRGDRVVASPVPARLHGPLATVFDPRTGQVVGTLDRAPGVDFEATKIDVTADGKWAVLTTPGMRSRGRQSHTLLFDLERGGPPKESSSFRGELGDEKMWATAVLDGRLVAATASRSVAVGENPRVLFHSNGTSRTFEGRASKVGHMVMTTSGRVIEGHHDGRAAAWDLATLATRGAFEPWGQRESEVGSLSVSKDGRRAVMGGGVRFHESFYDRRDAGEDVNREDFAMVPIRIVDLETGQTTLHRWLDHHSHDWRSPPYLDVVLSANGERVLSREWVASVADLEADRKPRPVPRRADASTEDPLFQGVSFLSGDRAFVDGDIIDLRTMTIIGRAAVPDCESGRLETATPEGSLGVVTCRVGVSNGDEQRDARLWRPDTRETRKLVVKGPVTAAALGPGGDVAAVVVLGFATVFDTKTGRDLGTVTLDGPLPASIAVSANGAHLLVGRIDGTVLVVNVARGTSITRYGPHRDWIAYTDDGYFDAPATVDTTSIAAVAGIATYQVHQVALLANRPDVLLERLGLVPPGVIEHYRNRAAARVRRAGLTETQLRESLASAPRVSLVFVEELERSARVTFDATDERHELARYEVAVNGSPQPLASSVLQGRRARQTVEVSLTPGRNEITISAINAAGLVSPRLSYDVQLIQYLAKSDLYYLGLGVSKYKNPAYDLAFADRDVTQVGTALAGVQGASRFTKVHTKVVTNEAVSVESVRQLRTFAARAKPEDTVVLFAAGHGVHSRDAEAAYYFATHEVDPRDLPKTAARFDLLEDILASSPARKKLLLLDTCESGDVDTGTGGASAGLRAPGLRARTRGFALVDSAPSERAGPARSRTVLDRNRFVYVDPFRQTGVVVVGASRADEASYEFDSLGHGLFTSALLETLASGSPDVLDGCVDVEKLTQQVEMRVAMLSGGQQHPALERVNAAAGVCLPLTGP